MKGPTLEDCFFISLIYLEEFVKRSLALPFKLYMKYDYWSHNRKVASAAKYAEEHPYTFPKTLHDEISEDPP
tara:strand:- start:79 stop:294 length:216 start_codon:yes stop_codon:yes gene_type:complete